MKCVFCHKRLVINKADVDPYWTCPDPGLDHDAYIFTPDDKSYVRYNIYGKMDGSYYVLTSSTWDNTTHIKHAAPPHLSSRAENLSSNYPYAGNYSNEYIYKGKFTPYEESLHILKKVASLQSFL